MHLSDHSLRQIDDAYLRSLDPEALCGLSVRLLADLREARKRLNQGPTNSSRPPSSRAPWEQGATGSSLMRPRRARISHGTRTATGSRVFALLASVIDTCRQRGHSLWPYIAAAIADRRAGRPLAPLPQPGG